ncbi:MAG: hypothetical protein KJ625_01730, partial [Actinobacteria bacterium]|nr:hypothetical protein [Actinomycetota bacterium]
AGVVEGIQIEDRREDSKDESIAPIGDFISLVAGFAAFLFPVTLNWYSREGAYLKGVDTVVGKICFALGVAVFVFAIVVLVGRFINPKFRLHRSPGWVYGMSASIIFMVSIVALVAPENIGGIQAGISYGIILELFAASAIGVGGLLKF